LAGGLAGGCDPDEHAGLLVSTYLSLAEGRRKSMVGEDTPTASGVHAVIGLTGLARESGGFPVVQERLVRFELPPAFDSEIFRRDSELLAEIASQNAESFAYLHDCAIRNDFGEARRIANQIGLTEERFSAEGGGMWIFIAAAAVFLAVAVTGDSPPTPQPPEPPPEETPIPDAGIPGGTPG
jgi:hypothetical protein